MKNLLSVFVLSLVWAGPLWAQQLINKDFLPHIEVSAEAEMEVIPDQVFIQLSLLERDKRGQKSIDQQESNLRQKLVNAGIDASRFQLENAFARYERRWLSSNEVVLSSRYLLELKNAVEVNTTMKILEEEKVQHAHISRIDHSEKEKYMLELRVEAMKKAKVYARSMLEAIGEVPGTPLWVQEEVSPFHIQSRSYKAQMEDSEALPELEMKKIKLKFKVHVKFAIAE